MAVRIEKEGPVTTVILDRPEVRNAIDPETAAELTRAFRAFHRDGGARVAVLWGDHGTFCSGADLKSASRGSAPRVRMRGDGPLGPTRMRLSKPVIAAISGFAVAGGLELALWSDLRVAEEDAVLGVFCRRWGVPLADGGTVRLPRLIGLGRALDMILTGRPVGAREALEMGRVNRVVPRGAARREAEALARDITQFPQACMLNDRRSAYDQFGLPLGEALINEARLALDTIRSGETLEGALRFASGEGRHGSFDAGGAGKVGKFKRQTPISQQRR